MACPTLYGSTSKYRAYGFIKRADTTFHFFLKTASDVDIKSLSILKGIAPYYNYISKLTLKMHAADYIEFMTLPAGSISLLETLVILVVSGWDYGDPRGPETIFEGGAPRLRKLVFYSGDRTRLAPQLMVPWNQLTHVIINDSSSSLSLVTDNLIQITQVEFASLKGYVRGGLPVPHQTITFPKLMHLRLGLKVERESRAITMWIRWIQKLRFPALQTLDIHGGGVGTRLRYLLPSVSPCLSLLRRLSFENIRATARELAEMLICCTSLEHLVLCIKKRDGIDADTALCALQTVLTSSSLMPSPNPEDWKPSTAALSTLRALMLTFEDFDEGGSPHEILHRYQALLISWMQHPMYKNALQAITLIIYEPEELDAYGTLPHWQDVIDDLEACAKENYDEGMEPEIVVEALMRRVGNNWFDYASF
ncbi:hypothetical protein H0H87_009619 [Tephrocybe sp. NHM501043]|nr:hypothetical protein H0H87_009619 [Tephrocybe sp. NHM501043]